MSTNPPNRPNIGDLFNRLPKPNFRSTTYTTPQGADPAIASVLAIDNIDAQHGALEGLEQQAINTFEASAQAARIEEEAIKATTKAIKEHYAEVKKLADLRAKSPYPMGQSKFGPPDPKSLDWRGVAGAMGVGGKKIDAGTNQTQEQLIRQRIQGGDRFPEYPSSENSRLRDVAQDVMHGNLRPSQAILAPGALLVDALNKGRLNPTVNLATGEMQPRTPGKVFGSRVGQTISKVGLGAGGFFAASEALPYALGGVERAYNQYIGNDVAYGQQAGFAGEQGVGAFGSGLLNRGIGTANLLTGLAGAVPGLSGISSALKLPFAGSDAAQFGAERRLEAFKAGFNPFDSLSINQAEGIQREVLNRGYRVGSDQEEDVIKGLYRLRNTTGMDSGQALDFMDIYVKRFNFSVDDVVEQLETFAEAAQAAGKSVDEFTKEVAAVSLNLTESGVDPITSQNLAQGFASVPGVSGEALNGAVNAQNPFLLMQALQRDPNLFSNPAKAALYLNNPAAALGDAAGGDLVSMVRQSMGLISQMYPGAEDLSLDERAALLKGLNIPGLDGLSARQIADLYEDGDNVTAAVDRSAALAPLNEAFNDLGVDDKSNAPVLNFDFQGAHAANNAKKGGPQLDALYANYRKSIFSEKDLTSEQRQRIGEMIDNREDPNKIQEEVNRFLKTSRGDQRDGDESRRLLIEASPELKKFFQFHDNSNNNALSGAQARTAGERNAGDPSDSTVWGSKYGGYFGG